MARSLEQCEAALFLLCKKKPTVRELRSATTVAKSLAILKNEQCRDFALSFLTKTPTWAWNLVEIKNARPRDFALSFLAKTPTWDWGLAEFNWLNLKN